MNSETLDLESLVASCVDAALREHVPPHPTVIANVICRMLFNDPRVYAHYHRKVEKIALDDLRARFAKIE